MIELNLLPDIKREYLKSQRTKRMIMVASFLVSASAVGLVVMLALFVFGIQAQHSKNLASDIKVSVESLQSQENLGQVLTVQRQLEALPALHDNKMMSSRLFDYFRVLIPNDVDLDNMTITFVGADGSGENSLELSGRSTDFKTVNILADSLKNATFTSENNPVPQSAFSSTVLDSISTSDDETVFTITTTFDATIFMPTEEGVRLTVPNITSSPSVTERPSSLFNQPESTGDEQ